MGEDGENGTRAAQPSSREIRSTWTEPTIRREQRQAPAARLGVPKQLMQWHHACCRKEKAGLMCCSIFFSSVDGLEPSSSSHYR